MSIGTDQAFGALRTYARSTNRRLTEVAADVVHGRLTLPAPTTD